MSHSATWQYAVENHWPCAFEPNVDLFVFLRELVFFSLFKTFLLLIVSQILTQFGGLCINGLCAQRSFMGSAFPTLHPPETSTHLLPWHHSCDCYPCSPSLTRATSPFSCFTPLSSSPPVFQVLMVLQVWRKSTTMSLVTQEQNHRVRSENTSEIIESDL